MSTMDFGPEQQRTVNWHDPAEAVAAGMTMPGLQYIRAMQAGELPATPIARLLGMDIVSVAAGDVVFRCVPDGSMLNPIGLVHGGIACTLLDSAAGCAVHSTLEAGVGYTSVEIKVSYLRPVMPGTALVAHGWVTKPGARVAFAEADLRDADDRLIATASTSCLIMRG